jgi:hypothetical protein
LEANWVSITYAVSDCMLTCLSLQICDALAGMAYSGIGTLVILCIMEGVAFMFKRRPMEDGHLVLDADDIVEKEL